MYRKIMRGFFCLILFYSVLLGQIEIDHNSFKEKDSLSRLEVYFSIPKKQLKFEKKQKQYQSKIFFRTLLMDKDSLQKGKKWTVQHSVADTASIEEKDRVVEINSFSVPAGNYKLKTLVRDRVSNNEYKSEEEIEVKSYQGNNIQISDLALAQKIQKAPDTNRFTRRSGYDIIPEVDGVLGERAPYAYPFFEIYNLGKDTTTYKLRYKILDIDKNIIKETEWMTRRRKGETVIDLYTPGIKIVGISSGSYSLGVEIIANNEADTLRDFIDIFIVNNPKKQTRGFSKNELAKFSENQLDSIFYPLQYIATKEEKGKYRNSDKEEKINFLAKFWDSRDPNPTTKVNEKRRNFEKKLIYADNRFGGNGKPGWKTDQGRVLILYGEPLEIERNTQEFETKPHLIWKYNDLENPVRFIFLQDENSGEYKLIHSEAQGEVKNRRWRQMISKDGQTPVNKRRSNQNNY